jgi:glycosyltransferase involved in cell wall biosynthesis
MDVTSHRLRLAIIYGPLLHYRIALFNALSQRYDLTVFTTDYSGSVTGLRFAIEVTPAWYLGPIRFQPGLRKKLRQGRFDVCIAFLDVGHLDTVAAIFLPISPRTLCWGVWLTGSEIANRVRLAAVRRCDAALFYCWKHLEDVAERGAAVDKLYVAPNTVAVPETDLLASVELRDSIVFVGSLTPRKGLDRLVCVFAETVPRLPKWIRLVIVGDGPERLKLETMAKDLGVEGRVEMPGRFNDPVELAPYYARALVSVSLSQAGLSVLQSMGHGVPFLTIRDSLSGGETLNIADGVNGFVVDDSNTAISAAFEALAGDPAVSAKMGAAARKHYQRYATIENYAQGFFDAIEGTREARIWRGSDFEQAEVDHNTQ